MSLIGLAILGKRNEPLYMCECSSIIDQNNNNKNAEQNDEDEDEQNDEQNNNNNNNHDPFGFYECTKQRGMRDSLSMENRFVIHSSLDRLDETIETAPGVGLPIPKGRTGSWLGLLSSTIDDDDGDGRRQHRRRRKCVYGYITATRIKFLLLIESTSNTKNVKEQAIRGLLSTIHEHYISYIMNPFTILKDCIDSKEFDTQITNEIRNYHADNNQN